MNKFRIHPAVKYAIDNKGIAIVKKGGKSFFYEYPEAAVWLLLINKPNQETAIQQIKAVLTGIVNKPDLLIKKCLDSWMEAGIII